MLLEIGFNSLIVSILQQRFIQLMVEKLMIDKETYDPNFKELMIGDFYQLLQHWIVREENLYNHGWL